MTETPAPVASALAKADAENKETIRKEVYEKLAQKFPDGKILIDTSSLVISGEK